jgi:hypothetical protein
MEGNLACTYSFVALNVVTLVRSISASSYVSTGDNSPILPHERSREQGIRSRTIRPTYDTRCGAGGGLSR